VNSARFSPAFLAWLILHNRTTTDAGALASRPSRNLARVPLSYGATPWFGVFVERQFRRARRAKADRHGDPADCARYADVMSAVVALVLRSSRIVMDAFARRAPLALLNETPHTASRPYTRTANGFVMGEFVPACILEEYEQLQKTRRVKSTPRSPLRYVRYAYHSPLASPRGDVCLPQQMAFLPMKARAGVARPHRLQSTHTAPLYSYLAAIYPAPSSAFSAMRVSKVSDVLDKSSTPGHCSARPAPSRAIFSIWRFATICPCPADDPRDKPSVKTASIMGQPCCRAKGELNAPVLSNSFRCGGTHSPDHAARGRISAC